MNRYLKIAIVSAASCLVTIQSINAQNQEDIVLDKNIVCLAKNMYYESRNQGVAGQLAVSAVVLNRVNDNRFPDTICEVVKQGPTRSSWKDPKIKIPVKHRCQFSWYCDGRSDNPKNKELYETYLNLAESILLNEVPFLDITDGATFYHADYVLPAWAKQKTKTTEIEDHIFYRWEQL
tara:strand:- start:309 stop:842 length:534 start_codon:yes stop_codon:yes gene_type:complete